MSEIVRLANANSNPRPQTKACQTCRYLTNRRENPRYWKCGIAGDYCSIESSDYSDSCGPTKRFWEEKPTPMPSFWKRLGDAIIARVKGKSHAG